MRKIFCLIAALLCLSVQAEDFAVGLAGNGYVTNDSHGARITGNGLSHWTSPDAIVSVYFYLPQPTKADLALLARGDSQIKVSYDSKSFDVVLQSNDFENIPVGQIDVKEAGYVRIDLQGISKKGDSFGDVKQLIVNGVEGGCNFVTDDFSTHFGRRGPSVHLAYTLPEGDIEWFYNEVTVPKEGEIRGSYYMASGFGEGYFGMQYNSPTERRVLFSVWSPFDTQDPREIPEDQKIKLLRKGKDVHIGEFGNEGSGGQSYLIYPWKADETYKFLMQVHPDGNGNTIYTAYFYATDNSEWRLIASFMRPQTNTWYRHAHSFLENFIPEQGNLSRKVLFGNQWARTKEGKWIPVENVKFTHDATAHARKRLDYQGGETDDNRYYLKMGGFFNDATPYGSKFSIKPGRKAPKINLKKLEKL